MRTKKNWKDMLYLIHLKVLRAKPVCETFKWVKLLVAESRKVGLQIPVKLSLGK